MGGQRVGTRGAVFPVVDSIPPPAWKQGRGADLLSVKVRACSTVRSLGCDTVVGLTKTCFPGCRLCFEENHDRPLLSI